MGHPRFEPEGAGLGEKSFHKVPIESFKLPTAKNLAQSGQ